LTKEGSTTVDKQQAKLAEGSGKEWFKGQKVDFFSIDSQGIQFSNL
jgi:hypothetical protein